MLKCAFLIPPIAATEDPQVLLVAFVSRAQAVTEIHQNSGNF